MAGKGNVKPYKAPVNQAKQPDPLETDTECLDEFKMLGDGRAGIIEEKNGERTFVPLGVFIQ